MLKIAIDYRPALFFAFGIGRYVRNLVPALLEADESVRLALYTVFYRRRSEVLPGHSWPDPSRCTKSTYPIPARAVVAAGRIFPGCARWLLPSFDLFHDTDYIVTPVKGRPRVVTLYDTAYLREHEYVSEEQSAKMRGVVLKLIEGVDHVITISEFSKEEIVAAFRVDPERITVTPLGVDPVFFEEDGCSAEVLDRFSVSGPFVLYIGTLEPRKNLVRLIRAFGRLHEVAPEHELLLVGRPGHAHERVLDEVRRLMAPGSVRWLGPLPDPDARALLRACTAFAYPSLYEGFGLPALEGMASGVPVLASDSSALREVCGDGALLVDPTSESEIFEGLRTLCLDRAEACEIADKGRLRARAFTWSDCGKRTVEAYRTALERRG